MHTRVCLIVLAALLAVVEVPAVEPLVRNVDCDAGDDLALEIRKAEILANPVAPRRRSFVSTEGGEPVSPPIPLPRPVVMNISGTCVTNLRIRMNDLTLRGAPGGATIVGADGGPGPVIDVANAVGVFIDHLTIRTAAAPSRTPSGITALRASVDVTNVAFEGRVQAVVAEHSTVRVSDSSIDLVFGPGVLASGDSSVVLIDTTLGVDDGIHMDVNGATATMVRGEVLGDERQNFVLRDAVMNFFSTGFETFAFISGFRDDLTLNDIEAPEVRVTLDDSTILLRSLVRGDILVKRSSVRCTGQNIPGRAGVMGNLVLSEFSRLVAEIDCNLDYVTADAMSRGILRGPLSFHMLLELTCDESSDVVCPPNAIIGTSTCGSCPR